MAVKKILPAAGIIAALTGITIGGFLAHKHFRAAALEGPDAPEESNWEEFLPGEDLTEGSAKEGNAEKEGTPKVKENNWTDLETDRSNDETPLPSSLNISMPFYTQAPYSDWDYPWQEACEEASILLVANLYNELYLDRAAYNEELLRLVEWEVGYFGTYEHTTVEQTAEMLKINYKLEAEIHEAPTFKDIQRILNEGHLIIAPFAGKLLGNPNFRNGGPIYHMLVIKGYDAEKNQIVTHDVGTRNGENYVYDWSIIENALHDWHDDDMLLGESKIIEVLPPSS